MPDWRTTSLIVPAVLAMATTALGARFNFTFYTNTDGLPQRQVMAIAQDPQGYLWLGTYGGLSRFNGRTFTTLRTQDGLSSNTVQDLVSDNDGSLWVATSGGGVCRVVYPRVQRCFRAPHHLPSDDVMSLAADGEGGVWVGTFAGITRLSRTGAAATFDRAGDHPLRNVWAVRQVQGRLLAGHEGGVVHWGGKGWERVPTNLPPATVRGFAVTSAGVWVGTEAGLYRAPPDGNLMRTVPVLPRAFIQDLTAIGDTLWVASRDGLFRIDDTGAVRLGPAEGLKAEVIHRVVADREGNLWLGTDEGLGKLVPGPITTLTTADGLPHPFVRAISEDQRGRLWVGTRNGVLILGRDGNRTLPGSALPGPRVYAFLPRDDGTVWVGTVGGVAVLREGQVERVITARHGLPANAVYGLAPAAGHAVWVATWAGLALVQGAACLPLPPEIGGLRALSLAVDRDGTLWLALRDGGAARLDRHWRVEYLRAREGLTDQVIWCIAHRGDELWLATNGDGALRVRNGSVERWDRRRGLADDFVWQVLPDRRGRVWMYTSQGLDRLEGETLRHFDVGDGLPDLEGTANAAWEDSRGHLWFGTAVGLVRYDPTRDPPRTDPPPIHLEQVRALDGRELHPGVTLPYRHGAIVFRLASLSFRNERATRFSYRLLPVQTQWSVPTQDWEIRYASLGAGRYRFEAVAVGSDASRSAVPAVFPFAVSAPWWQTLWAWGGGLLLGLVGAWGWARLRLVRSQALAARLEAEVAARTAELAAKQQELQWLAATDELTGLANRRRFFEVARQELQRLSRSPAEARLALLLLDLDGFKQINDTLGHNAGDAVLRAVGGILSGAVRATDTVARFGGDEFAVILPMTDRQGATLVATKLIRAVQELRVPWEGRQLSVSLSVGLAVVAPSAVFQEQEVTSLVQRADVALYAAKRRGGSCVLDDSETWA